MNQELWEKAHKENDLTYLSGTPPGSVIYHLGLELPDKKSKILEVGPGTGLFVDHLRDLGHDIYTHDIVDRGDKNFLVRFKPAFFDMAVAFLVIQHIPPDESMKLIARVVKSLKKDAKFHFDALTADYAGTYSPIQKEFDSGWSFPFEHWDLVDEKTEIKPGWWSCVIRGKGPGPRYRKVRDEKFGKDTR